MEHNIFREHKEAIVLVEIISLPACAFAVYMKTWPLAVISGVSFVSITVGLILIGIKDRREFEDLIWTKYQKGIIKLAYLLPYLKKHDGMSILQVDLASPSTPDGHKSIIADALDQAARYPA